MKINLLFYSFLTMFLMSTAATADGYNLSDNEYLPGKTSTTAVILAHGRGKYPTWFVVEPLRIGINEQLGYHTLSIQMPTDDVSWDDYDNLFPDAYKRIQAAIRFLRDTKKVKKIYLVGHSMGTRMVTGFLASHPDSGIAGFIGVGIRNGGGVPLDSNKNLRSVRIPVLDVYGDGGYGKDKIHAAVRLDMVSPHYKQVLIPGANHKFTRHEKELVDVVVRWLQKEP